jgi:N-formylglutamate deformylase
MLDLNVLTVHTPPLGVKAVPLVLDSPHSGYDFPTDFGAVMAQHDLRHAEDKYIDRIYASAPTHGVSFLCALFPRTYIDPNRHFGDIDLELLDQPWPDEYLPSGKADIGKALIWRNHDDGRPIYARKLSVDEIRHRIAHYLLPYQAALKALIEQCHAQFGVSYHVNCHSMEAVGGAMGEGGAGIKRADFVLGDRDGTTCSQDFTLEVSHYLSQLGYEVKINDPYKGVELVRAFSNPAQGRHSLQIELNKRLYLNADSQEPNALYPQTQQHLDGLVAHLARYARAQSNR